MQILTSSFFNEFTVELPKISGAAAVDLLVEKGIIAGYALDDNQLLVAATELTTDEDISKFAKYLAEVCS